MARRMTVPKRTAETKAARTRRSGRRGQSNPQAVFRRFMRVLEKLQSQGGPVKIAADTGNGETG